MRPSTGAHCGGVRVDTGVYDGGEIPMYYDSMIAKLIVHGRDRDDAIALMREALNGFVIRGIRSNIPFQAALLAHPKFVAGDFNTGFIAEHYAHGFHAEDVPHDDPDFLVALAAYVHRRYRAARGGHQRPARGAWRQGRASSSWWSRSMRDGAHRAHAGVGRRDFHGKTGASAVAVGGQQLSKSAATAQLGGVRVDGTGQRQAFHRAGRARRRQEPAGDAHLAQRRADRCAGAARRGRPSCCS